jgi:retron-type reverse transcriptase
MKTYKDLYPKVCSFENLYNAYLKAREGKRYKEYVLKFSWNLEEELRKLQKELINQTYQHGNYYEFTLYDAKKREIKAAPFRDRVVHHAICAVIEPIFDKGFIYDSYACRKGKGTHSAIKRLDHFIRSACTKWGEDNVYCLKCDISKYFDSIDHEVLMSLIERKIKDPKLLWLINKVVKSSLSHRIYETLFDFRDTGIPIGNLTSQLFANLYLNELDQFVKHDSGIKYYLRYMDDFLVLSGDKGELHQLESVFREFLKKNLKLELHYKKVSLSPLSRGIGFLGYRLYKSYKLIRGSTVRRFIKKIKSKRTELEKEVAIRSWLSFASYANTHNLKQLLRAIL